MKDDLKLCSEVQTNLRKGDLNFQRLLKETTNLSDCICCPQKGLYWLSLPWQHINFMLYIAYFQIYNYIYRWHITVYFLLCKIRSVFRGVQCIAINLKALNVFQYIFRRTKTNLAVKTWHSLLRRNVKPCRSSLKGRCTKRCFVLTHMHAHNPWLLIRCR